MDSQTKKNSLILSLILLFGGAFLFYYFNYNPSVDSANFISCPSKAILGLNCPGCGSQRMIHNLLHLNFGQAFRYNPLLFISLPFIIILVIQFGMNLFFGTKYRTKLFYNNKFVWFLFGIIMLYGILRNLPFWPFTYLAPPT